MIKPWVFEFFFAPGEHGRPVAASAEEAHAHFDRYIKLWERAEPLGFEGIFFSEHHFGRAYSPSPNLIIANMALRTNLTASVPSFGIGIARTEEVALSVSRRQ